MISSPRDCTPERVILEFTKTVLENPYISYYEIRREVQLDCVPTITIELELYEKKKED